MQIIGHRGVSHVAPENTWPGFDAALEMGVDAIEMDVRASCDGQLILMHDKRLERTTDGAGIVKHTPWAVIKHLDAGSWFDSKYAGARVPTLSATLQRYGQLTPMVLEIKKRGIESAIVDIVRRSSMAERITVTSFHFDSLLLIKKTLPECELGFISRDVSDANVIRTLQEGISQFCPPAYELTAAWVREIKQMGLKVRAWGVANQKLALAAREAGVDGMTVGQPKWLW